MKFEVHAWVALTTKHCIAGLLFTLGSVSGASALFDDDTVVAIRLEGPLKTIIKNKEREREEPFLLTVHGIQHSVTLSTRGRSRKRICRFPPLRINFQADDAQTSVFSGQGMLRLVTHCNRDQGSQDNAIQEYIAYRIFNLITEASYRARLLHITYVDTVGLRAERTLTRYGFVTESEYDVAKRLGGELTYLSAVSRKSLILEHAALVYLFQYLIGNTDWSLVTADGDDYCCHNGQLIRRDSRILYVPYDFDLSGLVNARYAKPDPSLPITRVTRRLYRGLCVPESTLRAALRVIKERREDIMNLLRSAPGLSPKVVKRQARYIEKFFVKAEHEQELLDRFMARCL